MTLRDNHFLCSPRLHSIAQNGTLIVFNGMHTIYIVFHSRGFYDVPRILIVDGRSFQALAAILDYVTHLSSMLCLYRSSARQNEFRPSQAALIL